MDNPCRRKQITFNVHPDFHKEIKVQAALRNMSINLFVVRALYNYMRKKEGVDNCQ